MLGPKHESLGTAACRLPPVAWLSAQTLTCVGAGSVCTGDVAEKGAKVYTTNEVGAAILARAKELIASMPKARTMYDKIFADHEVDRLPDGTTDRSSRD